MSTNGQIMREAAHLMAADVARGKNLTMREWERAVKTLTYLSWTLGAPMGELKHTAPAKGAQTAIRRWRAQAEKKA